MFELVLKGIVTGFILSIMIGPVFFVLLETSIRRGIRAAIAFDLGVFLSDVMYILLAYVFYAEVSALAQGKDQVLLKSIGGILFIIYGVYTWFKKPKEMKVNEVGEVVQSVGDYAMLMLKGFILNIANPLVVFYWFSVITFGAKTYSSEDPHDSSILFYLSIILITFFSIDMLKILGAKKLRPLVTDKLLVALNHLIGIVFVIFGIVLVLQGILKL